MTQHHHKHASASLTFVGPDKTTTLSHSAVASSDNNEGIRLCAYQKWEAAGKPAGDGVQFWLEAERELAEGEVVESKNEKFVQREGWRDHRKPERLEAEKTVSEDSFYRDNNRMFQEHGERGHRHGEKRE